MRGARVCARNTCIRARPTPQLFLTLCRSFGSRQDDNREISLFSGAHVRPLNSPLSLADLSELSPDTEAINSPASPAYLHTRVSRFNERIFNEIIDSIIVIKLKLVSKSISLFIRNNIGLFDSYTIFEIYTTIETITRPQVLRYFHHLKTIRYRIFSEIRSKGRSR